MGNRLTRSQTGEIPAGLLLIGAMIVPVTGAWKPIVGEPLHQVSLSLGIGSAYIQTLAKACSMARKITSIRPAMYAWTNVDVKELL
jgi:hypothetical protein